MTVPRVGNPGDLSRSPSPVPKQQPKSLKVSPLTAIQVVGRKVGKGAVDYSPMIALVIIGVSLVATCLVPVPVWGRGLVLIGGGLGVTGLWLTTAASLERKLGLRDDD